MDTWIHERTKFSLKNVVLRLKPNPMKTHVILICSLLLFGCAQTRKFQNPESLSMDVKILEDTTKMAKYERMFDEDAKIMSQ